MAMALVAVAVAVIKTYLLLCHTGPGRFLMHLKEVSSLQMPTNREERPLPGAFSSILSAGTSTAPSVHAVHATTQTSALKEPDGGLPSKTFFPFTEAHCHSDVRALKGKKTKGDNHTHATPLSRMQTTRVPRRTDPQANCVVRGQWLHVRELSPL